ncbi:helix-turn-helix transcriptional regulator [Vibrio sp. HA2012]|uniref:helix-turn-helix transcriptional regulator n=1 Tax=Vibrio sp. HA2012 TaxID=1971595 RepID=UPI0012FE4F35|nr:helix-turn-helix transcriptional regulator [Vibrio sp. HA2012]
MNDVKNDSLHNDVISINQNINISGLTLLSLWDTIGDPSTYRVIWPKDRLLPLRDNTIVAVYSRRGHGQIHLKNNKIISLDGHCVVFLVPADITHYFCCDLIWELNWMEFISTGASVFPLEQVITLEEESMKNEIKTAIDSLKKNDLKFDRLGVAMINKLIYEWLVFADLSAESNTELEKVKKVVAEIHLKIDKKWTIKELASIVNCSESHLRKLFIQYIKKSPKEYLLDAKLDYAYASLSHQHCTINQISRELGFYDNFHFSKAFKNKFGFSPSKKELYKIL